MRILFWKGIRGEPQVPSNMFRGLKMLVYSRDWPFLFFVGFGLSFISLLTPTISLAESKNSLYLTNVHSTLHSMIKQVITLFLNAAKQKEDDPMPHHFPSIQMVALQTSADIHSHTRQRGVRSMRSHESLAYKCWKSRPMVPSRRTISLCFIAFSREGLASESVED